MSEPRLSDIYSLLYARYGELNWWPAESPYEVIAGAVLTQNTAWSNVEKALRNFKGDITPERVMSAELGELAEIIRPAGFFNQKAVYLKSVTAWYSGYGYSVETVRQQPFEVLRRELLSVRGVGRETADSILLYAFGFPTFVVDAYTVRLFGRLPINVEGYENVKARFEGELSRDAKLYNNFHAAVVINGKEHCRKNPVCAGCPLADVCGYIRS